MLADGAVDSAAARQVLETVAAVASISQELPQSPYRKTITLMTIRCSITTLSSLTLLMLTRTRIQETPRKKSPGLLESALLDLAVWSIALWDGPCSKSTKSERPRTQKMRTLADRGARRMMRRLQLWSAAISKHQSRLREMPNQKRRRKVAGMMLLGCSVSHRKSFCEHRGKLACIKWLFQTIVLDIHSLLQLRRLLFYVLR